MNLELIELGMPSCRFGGKTETTRNGKAKHENETEALFMSFPFRFRPDKKQLYYQGALRCIIFGGRRKRHETEHPKTKTKRRPFSCRFRFVFVLKRIDCMYYHGALRCRFIFGWKRKRHETEHPKPKTKRTTVFDTTRRQPYAKIRS